MNQNLVIELNTRRDYKKKQGLEIRDLRGRNKRLQDRNEALKDRIREMSEAKNPLSDDLARLQNENRYLNKDVEAANETVKLLSENQLALLKIIRDNGLEDQIKEAFSKDTQ